MLNIVLFGPPGAGKGTQAAKLIEQYKLSHLSTGDILRSEIAGKTKLGQEAKNFMDKGELVPDQLVIDMIEVRIRKETGAKGFIFDGFPRTTAQAKALDNLLEGVNQPISVMITLEVENEELVQRLLLRGKESGREDDKDESVIRNRIKVYENETTPVKDFYASKGKYQPVNGSGEIDEIFEKLCTIIDEYK
jgi:adenylate kinase